MPRSRTVKAAIETSKTQVQEGGITLKPRIRRQNASAAFYFSPPIVPAGKAR